MSELGSQAARRILIVDDNPAIHEDFGKILAPDRSGDVALDDLDSLIFGDAASPQHAPAFDLAHAHQGKEALAMVEAAKADGRPFALAFVDVRMPPGWDGIETISRIWAVDPRLQVVICTAYSDYGWEAITERFGLTDQLVILKKPFDYIEALQLAHTLTNKWNLARRAELRMDELEQMVAERTAALEAAQEESRQAYKMEAVGRLAAGVAHDFNNLLTVIQGYSSRHLGMPHTDPEIAESLGCIAEAARRAATLTRQLLAFSRKQVMQPEVIRLDEQLRKLDPMLRPLLGAHIELQYELAPDLPPLFADVCNLEQIVLNLTLNARDAMPHGGRIILRTALVDAPPERVQNGEEASRTYLRLTVADSGIGMDEATVRNLFEPFFTTKDVGRGTGMGLATVHGIVQQHGGWIDVETVPNQGSAFHVFLPPATKPAEVHVAPLPAAPLIRGSGTVLIAEDEEAVSLLAAEIFEEQGFNVITAATGTAALELWKRHADDIVLVFTDMIMPGGISGRELAQRIQNESPATPVVFTSGYSKELLRGGMHLEEGVNYLPKPYLPADLTAIIARVFNSLPIDAAACAA